MLYLIGIGLNEAGISLEGVDALNKCKKIYLESYTIEFPYHRKKLEKKIKKKVILVDREFVESFKILEEAKKTSVALLVYGSPLTATTHTSLIQEARRIGIKTKIIYSASILDAITEVGLHIYKFGKITSIPKHRADSFAKIISTNLKINAHSLVLVDIGLELNESLDILSKALAKYRLKIDNIIVCSRMGTKDMKINYGTIVDLKNRKVKKPFCIIIPTKLHFTEEEFLNQLKTINSKKF